jgi:hypothetical protein
LVTQKRYGMGRHVIAMSPRIKGVHFPWQEQRNGSLYSGLDRLRKKHFPLGSYRKPVNPAAFRPSPKTLLFLLQNRIIRHFSTSQNECLWGNVASLQAKDKKMVRRETRSRIGPMISFFFVASQESASFIGPNAPWWAIFCMETGKSHPSPLY